MKLNPDCVRDVLLQIEELSTGSIGVNFAYAGPPLPQYKAISLPQYSIDEIHYHIRQCELSELLYNCKDHGGVIVITDLSPEGHKFIANIREQTMWNGIKEISAKVGIASLDAFKEIASNVISELIKAQFNLGK